MTSVVLMAVIALGCRDQLHRSADLAGARVSDAVCWAKAHHAQPLGREEAGT